MYKLFNMNVLLESLFRSVVAISFFAFSLAYAGVSGLGTPINETFSPLCSIVLVQKRGTTATESHVCSGTYTQISPDSLKWKNPGRKPYVDIYGIQTARHCDFAFLNASTESQFRAKCNCSKDGACLTNIQLNLDKTNILDSEGNRDTKFIQVPKQKNLIAAKISDANQFLVGYGLPKQGTECVFCGFGRHSNLSKKLSDIKLYDQMKNPKCFRLNTETAFRKVNEGNSTLFYVGAVVSQRDAVEISKMQNLKSLFDNSASSNSKLALVLNAYKNYQKSIQEASSIKVYNMPLSGDSGGPIYCRNTLKPQDDWSFVATVNGLQVERPTANKPNYDLVFSIEKLDPSDFDTTFFVPIRSNVPRNFQLPKDSTRTVGDTIR